MIQEVAEIFGGGNAAWVGIVVTVLVTIRGIAATVAEQMPNKWLGPVVKIIDILAGNRKNAAGSQ